jgi:protein-tyrosine phosphatase
VRQVPGYPLWAGHAGDVRNHRGLFEASILTIVDLAREEPQVLVPRDFVYCRFPLVDGPSNPRWLIACAVETVARSLSAGVPTLVACGAGMSRSPCVAGAALARTLGCPAEEGLAIVLTDAQADVSPALWAEIREA